VWCCAARYYRQASTSSACLVEDRHCLSNHLSMGWALGLVFTQSPDLTAFTMKPSLGIKKIIQKPVSRLYNCSSIEN